MTSRDFAFWLQGFFEISGTDEVTPEQVRMVKKHLNLVFKHEIDPSMGDQKHQNELNKIHSSEEEKLGEEWGPQPSENHIVGPHGWYNPAEGKLRC
jgi:hypothetical protein